MSFRVTRIPAIESGPWDTRRNKATVVLPADAGIVDLDSTRLMCRTKVTCSLVAEGERQNDVPFPVGFGYCDGTQVARSAHCLIKTVNSRSSALGILLPSRPYQNVLTSHLEAYTRSRSGMRADTLFGRCVTKWYNRDAFSGIPGSIFFYPEKFTVGEPSIVGPLMVTPEIPIPMYCLDSRARGMRQYPCAVFGDEPYSVEFEDHLTLVSALQGPANIPVNNITSDAGNLIGTAADPLILTGVADINEIPLWSNQFIHISFTPDGHPEQQLDVKIVSITFTAGNVCQVVVEQIDGTAGINTGFPNTDIADITINWIQPDTVTWEIEDINLEVISAVLDPKTLQSILSIPLGPQGLDMPYLDYEQFQVNVPQTNLFNYSLTVGPGCVGILSLFLANDSLEGVWNNVTEYAYSINGTDTADGYRIFVGYEGNNTPDTVIGRQLHNTRLTQFFRNIGMKLRRYDIPVNGVHGVNLEEPSYAIFPQIIPNVPVQQTVQITLRAAADPIPISTLWLFPMYKRTEQIRSGRVAIING